MNQRKYQKEDKITITFPKKKKIIKWPWFHGLWEKWKVLKKNDESGQDYMVYR